MKLWLAALAVALALVAGEAAGSPAARQDVSIPMDDGVSIAATLYVPDGAPPAGGWPAIVFLHALAGNRQQMASGAERHVDEVLELAVRDVPAGHHRFDTRIVQHPGQVGEAAQ